MKSAGHGCLAQATERFGKKEKAPRLAFFKRVLGATSCERPHETHKAKKTKTSTKERKQGAKYVNISLNFF